MSEHGSSVFFWRAFAFESSNLRLRRCEEEIVDEEEEQFVGSIFAIRLRLPFAFRQQHVCDQITKTRLGGRRGIIGNVEKLAFQFTFGF